LHIELQLFSFRSRSRRQQRPHLGRAIFAELDILVPHWQYRVILQTPHDKSEDGLTNSKQLDVVLFLGFLVWQNKKDNQW